MKKTISHLLFIGLIFLLSSCTKITRHSCFDKDIAPDKLPILTKVSTQFEEWLDHTGQNLVIAARRGQNLDSYHIQFSHAAFIKKETEGWVVYHLLTQCPNDIGGLYKQDLMHFLAPATQNYRIAVVAPEPKLQEKISALLESDEERYSVFESRYNGAAYPFGLNSQNSNSWILEFFSKAAADHDLHTRVDAVEWLKQDDYQPSLLDMGGVKQFFVNMIIPNIDKSDQPAGERKAGRIWINSGDSTLNYVSRYSAPMTSCETTDPSLNAAVCIFTALP